MLSTYLLLFSSLVSASLAASIPVGPTVALAFGTYRGSSNTVSGTDSFLGLPFAAPPVGNNRLRAPQPINVYYGSTVQDATIAPNDCPQQNAPNGITLPPQLANYSSMLSGTPVQGSEDCLYLNVYRPSSATSSSKLPVIYFIFGSGFAIGGASEFDGTNIVTQSIAMGQEVIVVVGNYRLSAWGWLPGQEAQNEGIGNLGLLDQRAALQWVHSYISNFGGDPNKVTLMGESAGAMSVAMQMVMNGGSAGGLFRAAIMESGSVFPFGPMANGQSIFDDIAVATGCDTAFDKIACLRTVSFETFYNAVENTPNSATAYRGPAAAYVPRVDYSTLVDLPQNLFSEGRFAKVPILIGENEDEGSIWCFTSLNVTTDDHFSSYVQSFWPWMSQLVHSQIIQQYPDDPADGCPYDSGDLYSYTPESKRIASLLGDAIFIAPRRFVSQTYVRNRLPVWSYHFSHVSETPFLGSYHGSEVPYVFGETPDYLSTQMRALWISFANTLDPNNYGSYDGGLGLPYWPQYGSAATQMEFGITNNTLMTDNFREDPMNVIIDNMGSFIV